MTRSSRIYWTALTFLDPLGALLLFLRPLVGLVVTMAIIATEVLHNTLVRVSTHGVMYLSQVAFLSFVVCTVYFAWKGVPAERHDEARPPI